MQSLMITLLKGTESTKNRQTIKHSCLYRGVSISIEKLMKIVVDHHLDNISPSPAIPHHRLSYTLWEVLVTQVITGSEYMMNRRTDKYSFLKGVPEVLKRF